jgi:hypothetical protein
LRLPRTFLGVGADGNRFDTTLRELRHKLLELGEVRLAVGTMQAAVHDDQRESARVGRTDGERRAVQQRYLEGGHRLAGYGARGRHGARDGVAARRNK